ncbi:MAG TPA: HYR domain-containing protein [Candidatus Acidoferrum sp.]|nr:HYR domain-containing protein [Candidatus Acidoferrum sp.]
MLTPRSRLILMFYLGLGASILPGAAQVFFHPNQLSGTIRFTNSNPAILSLLNPPGDEGMSNLVVLASSLPPAPTISANSDTLQADKRVSASYQLTVESDSPGISYLVSPYLTMEGGDYTYWVSNLASAPVTIGITPPALDFDECVGVVTVEFVTPGGAPVAVDGGLITCFDGVTGDYTGQRGAVAAGVTEQRLYLRGTQMHRLDITVNRGTNFYTDRIESFLTTNVLVVCDQFTTVQMVIPDAGTLGTVTGTVDMVGKFELTVAGNKTLNYPDWTSVVANYGPFYNQRWGALGGANFTTPSSGAYTLSNMVPSTLDPASVGYQVLAQMAFGSNRTIQTFQTPALGSGVNPPLVVTPGASIDLSNLFVITPGFMRGQMVLQGPSESLGRSSLLRGIQHAGDDATDGIPDAMGTYGVYWSVVEAVGVDRLAGGATFTASSGLGVGDFDGTFNPATSAFEGQYELALGGLSGQNSLWRQSDLSLTLYSGGVTNDDDYYFNVMDIAEGRPNEVEIVPGQPAPSDIGYCFSEVKIVFRSTSGTFYGPQVRFSYGSFTNTDFQGHQANYTVGLEVAAGTPLYSSTASNIGQVVMYLPQGTYQLNPSVIPADTAYALAGLKPLDLTVGCGQQIAIEPCLQLNLDAPACSSPTVHITGSVRSCTNNVTSISYQLDAGPSQLICSGCGDNPSFAFDLLLPTECDNHTLTVMATDDTGGSSTVTTTVHYDATPPTIQCPDDILASACDTNGAIVNFNVTATDNCSGPVTVVANPPSGSSFPVGTNVVTCVATDACGNSSQCTFNVIVGGSLLSIERAIIIRWACGGTLQGADDLSGPWTDIPGATSPYAVATSAARKFYRTQN